MQSGSPTVFISYRRDDTQAWAGRIADFLNETTNVRVLIDVDSISRGEDYTEAIRRNIKESDAILVLVGKGWLDAVDDDGARRLLDPDDPVRLEVHSALTENKLVVPVLVDGANMPARKSLPDDLGDLSVRNGLSLGHQSFRRDLSQLVTDFRGIGAREGRSDSRTKSPWLSALLSLLMPGVGQMYVNPDDRRGLKFFGAYAFGIILLCVFSSTIVPISAIGLIIALFAWIWGIVDAALFAKAHNRPSSG